MTDNNKLINAINEGILPDRGDRGAYKGTIQNLKALFDWYGITCQYDCISKAQSIIFNNSDNNEHDLKDSGNYSTLYSLLALNNMPQSSINLIPALMINNTINPILEYLINAKHKPKQNFFRELADSLIVDDSDKHYRDLALKTWLFQCVAAADSAIHAKVRGAVKFELVLVLQGKQGIGKTTFFKSLVPEHLKNYVATGEHLDPDDVTSLRRCLSVWLCEIGELDATFRRSDIERLKAFLSQGEDKIRLPYDKAISNYKRRTSFCGSVNPEHFLVDKTGNRRFLPVAVKHIERLPNNAAFLSGLWAEIWHEYTTSNKAIWWASHELETLLKERLEQHEETSPIEEMILTRFSLAPDSKPLKPVIVKDHYTATQVLIASGINNPNKSQVREVKPLLERFGVACVQNNGIRGYWLADNEKRRV